MPDTISIEALAEGPALLWAESLRRSKAPLIVRWQNGPGAFLKSCEKASDRSAFLIVLALLTAARKSSGKGTEISPIEAAVGHYILEIASEIFGESSCTVVGKEPFRVIPRRLRADASTVDFAALNSFLQNRIRRLHSSQLPLGIESAVDFMFQATANALDEEMDVCESEPNRSGYLAIFVRRFRVSKVGTVQNDLSIFPLGVRAWATRNRKENGEFFLITVADLGRGIQGSIRAAGLAGAASDAETIATAFKKGFSSKKRGRLQPGFGLPRIAESGSNLGAIIFIQSGGVSLYKDFSGDKYDPDALDLQQWPEAAGTQIGTSISMIWPSG